MQLSLRKRFSAGYQFDVNYTLGYAKDHGSLLEGDSTFGNFDNGGYTGFLIDTLGCRQAVRPRRLRRAAPGERQLDRRGAVGRGSRFGADMPGVLERRAGRLVHGGHRALEQRVPVQRLQLPPVLVHQLEPAGQRRAGRPRPLPETRTTRERGQRISEPVCRRRGRADEFRRAYPGEAGLRNSSEGDGYFSIDFSLSKGWTMPWAPATNCASGGTRST